MKPSHLGAIALAVVLPLAVGMLLSAPRRAMAADATVAPSCTITTTDVAAITTAQTQGLLAELAVRKALLTRIITCAKSDAQTLQTDLNAVKASDGAATLQTRLSGRLDDAMNYYDIELGKVTNAGIAGTQNIANEVLTWRTSNYDPLALQVANFTLWSENQTIFNTGTARLQSIESIVTFVEQAAPNSTLQADLVDAQTLMKNAVALNAQATGAMLQSLPPDQTLSLIQQSLQSLSAAYQKFFDISTILQTLLPAK